MSTDFSENLEHYEVFVGFINISGLLVVPRVSKSRTGGGAFSYQAPLCGTSCQFGFRKQTPSLPLTLG